MRRALLVCRRRHRRRSVADALSIDAGASHCLRSVQCRPALKQPRSRPAHATRSRTSWKPHRSNVALWSLGQSSVNPLPFTSFHIGMSARGPPSRRRGVDAIGPRTPERCCTTRRRAYRACKAWGPAEGSGSERTARRRGSPRRRTGKRRAPSGNRRRRSSSIRCGRRRLRFRSVGRLSSVFGSRSPRACGTSDEMRGRASFTKRVARSTP